MAPRTRGEHAAMLAIEQAVESEALPADLIRQTGRRRQCSLDEQIGNISLEAGELELAAAAEEREVDAPLQLTLPLGANVGEASGASEREAAESRDASRVQGGELLAVLRLIASLAVGDAKLDLIEESRLQLRQTIRARKLREVIELGDVAIVAAAIGAHPRSEQEPLPHQGLALHEDPEILDVQLVVLEVAHRPRDRLGESAEEVLSDGPRLIEVADLVLRADLRGQRQPVLRRVDVYAVEVEIVLKI